MLAGLEKYLSPENQPACYAFLDEWNASAEQEKLFEIADDITERMRLAERLEKVDTAVLMRLDSLPCIDEVIIGRFMQEIAENIIKIEEILEIARAPHVQVVRQVCLSV